MATENASGKTVLCTEVTGVIVTKKAKVFYTIVMAQSTLVIFQMTFQMAKAQNNS